MYFTRATQKALGALDSRGSLRASGALRPAVLTSPGFAESAEGFLRLQAPYDLLSEHYRPERASVREPFVGRTSRVGWKGLIRWRDKLCTTMSKDVKPTRKNLMAIEDRIELSEIGRAHV